MRRELSEKEILDTVRDIRHEAPGIGAYKLYLMLKELYPDGMRGRDWFYGLMHESHLMLKPGKRRHTTSSNHPYRKYKNMIKGLTVNRINQLWVADITYIDTDEGVAYLHLLTDAFTHEIIGWVLSDSLVASNTVTALDMGISHVSPLGFDGLIHHSDRGVQYCCNQYIDRLQAIKATISMTEDYKPTDNAIAERVNGIIKQEWLYRMKRPPDVVVARDLLGRIIDFYNNRRPHRATGTCSHLSGSRSTDLYVIAQWRLCASSREASSAVVFSWLFCMEKEKRYFCRCEPVQETTFNPVKFFRRRFSKM